MDRGNSLQIGGYRVLRFPAWVVRQWPEYVAAEILKALQEGGYQGWNAGGAGPSMR
jgi:very-short-patch-repair endonuclease